MSEYDQCGAQDEAREADHHFDVNTIRLFVWASSFLVCAIVEIVEGVCMSEVFVQMWILNLGDMKKKRKV